MSTYIRTTPLTLSLRLLASRMDGISDASVEYLRQSGGSRDSRTKFGPAPVSRTASTVCINERAHPRRTMTL